jgi:hypothetical protein
MRYHMKNLLCLCALLIGFSAFAADSRGRVDTRVLSGVKNYVQDEFQRNTTPVFVVNSLLYISTNLTDGIIFVKTNATVLVHIGLPNPTNNVGRKYEVTTMGASTAILTNWYTTSLFTSNNTMASQTAYFINSNKTALAYSTGTNWLVRDY